MGLAYSSVPVQDLSPGITPSSSNWITTHSRKAGLTIVEVQRLWDQFRQLGASSVTGRLNSSVTSGRNDRERLEEGGYLPSNQQLQMVVTMMSEPKRDWRRLLNTLGFTESEISTAEESNQNDREQVLIDLLTEWRDNEPGVTEDLRQALMSTNNLDIANRL